MTTDASRRNFLTLAGAGVAAAGVAAALPLTRHDQAADLSSVTASIASLPAGATGAVAAFVRDVEKGEVAVMVEGREVLVTDHDLVARLATVIHGAGA